MDKNVPNKLNTSNTAANKPQTITSISFTELEELIVKWNQELEQQELIFNDQVMQLNARDQLLFINREKIEQVNDAIEDAKNEQQNLEYELNFMLSEQKELENLLAPLETLLEEPSDRLWDSEREKMYYVAENLDTQIRQMSENLKEVIEHINQTNRSQDSNNPIVQISRILDAHMLSMQWLDNSITQISIKIDQLNANHNYLRRDNERFYQ